MKPATVRSAVRRFRACSAQVAKGGPPIHRQEHSSDATAWRCSGRPCCGAGAVSPAWPRLPTIMADATTAVWVVSADICHLADARWDCDVSQ